MSKYDEVVIKDDVGVVGRFELKRYRPMDEVMWELRKEWDER